MKQMKYRPTATAKRTAAMGEANQIEHEQNEKLERDALKKKLSDSHAAARKKGMGRKAKNGTGMDAGTVGGSWLASFR